MGKHCYGKDVLDKAKHFVVIGTRDYIKQISAELNEADFKESIDYIYIVSSARSTDYRVNGVIVGRFSHFPDTWKDYMVDENCGGEFRAGDFIQSIGRFTSINGSAQIHGDHPLKTLTVSLFPFFIAEGKQALINNINNEIISNAYNRVKIGNDVWIGANVFINCSKVKEIGDGSIIGSNAVVIEDVPPYAIVVGVPGKIKKYRYTPEQIECLIRVKWWEWSDEEIKENAELLYNPEIFFERFM